MNLVGYTATALSRNDIEDTPTNKNVVDFAIVELKDLSGNLVVMYDDAEGANPETQKTCDTNGQVTFFAEVGDYDLEINGKAQRINLSSGLASFISTKTDESVQDFVDSFALKIFQSPTDGGLTEIQTRTVNASEVYEVRKTSDDSLATIYSDAAGTTEIAQNGTDNKSGSDGVIEFYIEDAFDELKIETESGVANFKNNVYFEVGFNNNRGDLSFVETFTQFHSSPFVPDNIADENGGGTMTGGGFAEQWTITLTGGVEGSSSATTDDSSVIGGAGTDKWPCAILYSNGKFQFNIVTSSTVSSLNFMFPLEYDAAGSALSPTFDAALGQHLTQNATKAFVNLIADRPMYETSAYQWSVANFVAEPPKYNKIWDGNAAVKSYGILDVDNIVSRFFTEVNHINIVNQNTGLSQRPTSLPAGIAQGCHLSGHGVTAEFNTAEIDSGYLEFVACVCQDASSSLNPNGIFTATITVSDGVQTIYTAKVREFQTRHTIPFANTNKLTVDIVSDQNNVFNLRVYETKLWKSRLDSSPLFNENERTVLCGDSWWDRYDAGAVRFLNERIEAKGGRGEVLDSALGGQTASWAISNFDTLIKAKEPDHVIFHFYTNDNNAGDTFEEWISNMMLLVSMCSALGIRSTIIKPMGTASEGQSQDHAEWSVKSRKGINYSNYTALPEELADPAAYVNNYGKYTGKRVTVGKSPVYAKGGLNTDGWNNPNTDRISNLEAVTYDYTLSDGATYEIGKNVTGGLSDGITTQQFGDNTNNTFTPSVVQIGGVDHQQLQSDFGSPLTSGRARLKFNSDSVGADSHDYFVIIQVRDSDASTGMDVITDAGGSDVAITSSNVLGTTVTDSNGDFDFAYRTNVVQDNFYVSVIASTGRSSVPVTGITKVKNCWLIDLDDAQERFGIDYSSLSDIEVYNALLSALESIPPTFIHLTDVGDGEVKKLQINNGVVEIV